MAKYFIGSTFKPSPLMQETYDKAMEVLGRGRDYSGPCCDVCDAPATGGLVLGPMLRVNWCSQHAKEVCEAVSEAVNTAKRDVA